MTTEKSKNRWKRVFAVLEGASILGGLLVVIGLWLEGLRDLGAKLVLYGVAVEVFASFWVYRVSRTIEKFDAEELAEVHLKAAKANERAAEANLELEKLKTPRTLSVEQRERITRAMRAHAGQAFVVFAAADPEAADLASTIRTALIDAQWNAGNSGSIHAGGIGLATGRGVEIEWASSTSEHIKTVANALAAVLTEEGLVATTGPDPQSRLFPYALRITVGTKPQ